MPEDSNRKSQQVQRVTRDGFRDHMYSWFEKGCLTKRKKSLEKETAQTREFMLSLIFPSS